VRDLGLIGYVEAVALQERLAADRLVGAVPDTLLLLEHPPVITLGRRGTMADVLVSEELLARKGVEVQRSSRGGLVTYHGPGQLVGYPIVHLREAGLTIPEYASRLQRAVIAALAEIGVEAWTDSAHVGVWTERGKIAAVGIAQRRGVAMHGFAVNLQPDMSHFQLIDPCGIGELGVTSAEQILGEPVDVPEFKERVAGAVAEELRLALG